jgi:hypothetical protein
MKGFILEMGLICLLAVSAGFVGYSIAKYNEPNKVSVEMKVGEHNYSVEVVPITTELIEIY